MKVFRFMSQKEYDLYITGETLVNERQHAGYTSSVGFCFLDRDDYHPAYAYQFLAGIVDDNICCVFETKKKLKECSGEYADPYSCECLCIDEYCTTTYSKKTFTLLETYTYSEIKKWDE